MWGVDMAANEEYEAQRAGCHYFSVIAKQLGIEVGVPPTSDLFRPRFLYGLDEHTHVFAKLRARKFELESRLVAAEQVVQQKQQEAAFLRGALDDLNYCWQTWPDKEDRLGPPEIGVQIIVPSVVTEYKDNIVTEYKGNGQAPPPSYAEARLGPGHFVGV
jgi:hypothetical protein